MKGFEGSRGLFRGLSKEESKGSKVPKESEGALLVPMWLVDLCLRMDLREE